MTRVKYYLKYWRHQLHKYLCYKDGQPQEIRGIVLYIIILSKRTYVYILNFTEFATELAYSDSSMQSNVN